MSQHDTVEDESTLRPILSNEEKKSHPSNQISPLHIPRNRSTGDLLANASQLLQNGKHRVTLQNELNKFRSPIALGHEHGLGKSGLRRIRQHASSRVPSRAPTVPGSPTTPYALPARSSSLNLGQFPQHGLLSSVGSSPAVPVAEDLSRFPSESLHSFSFAHQSEDVLHSHNSVLKRAVDFMRDRLRWGSQHPGVLSAEARISGDPEAQSMVELLIRANVMGKEGREDSRLMDNGPVTGPADARRNVFDFAFEQHAGLRDEPNEIEEVISTTNQAGHDDSHNTSARFDTSVGNHDSSSDTTESQPSKSQDSLPTTGLRRTYTDVSLLTLQTRLTDAMARPYKAIEASGGYVSQSPEAISAQANSTPIRSALSTSHNSRWVPAAQAIFTTELESPWTVLAANDLACLVFGVTQAEVKKMSMLEIVRKDRRAWLEHKLRAAGSITGANGRHAQSQSARSSPKTQTPMGGGITASLLSKPSWREQRSQTAGYKNVNGGPDVKRPLSRGVLLCGDILPIQKRNNATGAASLWVKEKKAGLIWVLEEITEDVARLKLDEDANIIAVSGGTAAVFQQSDELLGKPINNVIPQLPLVDGYAVDKTAVERDDDSKYYVARTRNNVGVPVSVSMNAVSRSLQISSFPHIAGIVVASSSDLRIISANSMFSAALFGKSDPSGMLITDFLPQFDNVIDFLTEEEMVALVDGIVVPEHSFRRASALLALRENQADPAAIFAKSSGLLAKHRDGSQLNVDVQMRVVRSERTADTDAIIQEQDEESDDDVNEDERSETVYALWITYSRHLHSATSMDTRDSPAISRPDTPLHQPSPGQTNRTASPVTLSTEEDPPPDSPTTITQKIQEATSQPISESPPKVPQVVSTVSSRTHSAKSSRTNKKISDFAILEDMGQGAYGQVKLARYLKGTQEKVVLKYVTKRRILVDTWTRDRRLGTVPLEIHVLDYLSRDGLRHPNIVEMIDFFEDDVNYYIEMVPHGLPGVDLFDYIEMRTTMDESECRNIFLQVVAAVHHLHTKALVVHRDIKDENIILDGEGKVKLIDFGSAAYIKSGPFDVFVGTIDYAAPEVLAGKSYGGKEQDIWALGILLYTLVYKENPFYSIDEILDHELRIPWIMSDNNIDLIRAMLDRDVQGRLDITGVMEHQWCKEASAGV